MAAGDQPTHRRRRNMSESTLYTSVLVLARSARRPHNNDDDVDLSGKFYIPMSDLRKRRAYSQASQQQHRQSRRATNFVLAVIVVGAHERGSALRQRQHAHTHNGPGPTCHVHKTACAGEHSTQQQPHNTNTEQRNGSDARLCVVLFARAFRARKIRNRISTS